MSVRLSAALEALQAMMLLKLKDKVPLSVVTYKAMLLILLPRLVPRLTVTGIQRAAAPTTGIVKVLTAVTPAVSLHNRN